MVICESNLFIVRDCHYKGEISIWPVILKKKKERKKEKITCGIPEPYIGEVR